MFGLSLTHLILFGVIALIFIGPEQLPEVARTIARLLNDLRRATQDFQSHFTGQFRDEADAFRDLRQQVLAPPPAEPTPEKKEEHTTPGDGGDPKS